MRPPEFTGGNSAVYRGGVGGYECSFNEAAGIHRRKPLVRVAVQAVHMLASMRPPEFTGGNLLASQRGSATNSRLQ